MNSFAIYGAGEYGSVFYETVTKTGAEIDFFIDQYKSEKTLFEKKIYRIDEVPTKNTTILISVPSEQTEITNKLKKRGFTNVINFVESINKYPNILKNIRELNALWMVKDNQRLINPEAMDKFKELLEDEKSKQLLDNIIHFRETFVPENYVFPDNQTNYFPEDVPLFQDIQEVHLADCGAYNADTILSTVEQNRIDVDSINAFEPDPDNFSSLVTNLRNIKKNRNPPPVNLYPLGIWNETTVLNFNSRGDNSSILDDKEVEHSTKIQVSSIDETLLFTPVNYIKMDVEGAEIEGLKGAESTIKKNKPLMAICLYHEPEHLWEIPLLIQNMVPDLYSFYMRTHDHLCVETVLYCIPRWGANSS